MITWLVNTVVTTRDGGITTFDIPVSSALEQFHRDYLKLTGRVHESEETFALGEDYMVIGTSALTGYEINGAVNIYAGCHNNLFLSGENTGKSGPVPSFQCPFSFTIPRWMGFLRSLFWSGCRMKFSKWGGIADDPEIIRCHWANPKNPRYLRYHDEEWGVPVHDDRRLFEMLVLESFQAGLSWECTLISGRHSRGPLTALILRQSRIR